LSKSHQCQPWKDAQDRGFGLPGKRNISGQIQRQVEIPFLGHATNPGKLIKVPTIVPEVSGMQPHDQASGTTTLLIHEIACQLVNLRLTFGGTAIALSRHYQGTKSKILSRRSEKFCQRIRTSRCHHAHYCLG
jgi:hypothetical protein